MTMADLIDNWERNKTQGSNFKLASALARMNSKGVRHRGFAYTAGPSLTFTKVAIVDLVDAATVEIEPRPDVAVSPFRLSKGVQE